MQAGWISLTSDRCLESKINNRNLREGSGRGKEEWIILMYFAVLYERRRSLRNPTREGPTVNNRLQIDVASWRQERRCEKRKQR